MAKYHPLFTAWLVAESFWTGEIERAFPRGRSGDLRYTDKGKGAPGSSLRAAYDAWCKAGNAWAEARDSDLVLIDL